MRHVIIDAQTHFEDVKWGGKPIKDPRRIADRSQRIRTYREVAQIYHDIAEMLRDAGFLSEASTYRLLEHRMRRGVLFTTHHYGAWLFRLSLTPFPDTEKGSEPYAGRVPSDHSCIRRILLCRRELLAVASCSSVGRRCHH